MGRIRTVKPEFFKHEELYNAEKESGLPLRVAFCGLWTVADREGRFKWKPNTIKLDVLPFDDVDMLEVLAALIHYKFIRRYDIDGKEYGFIPSFKDHQVINNRESKSTIPEPIDASFTRADAACGEGKGREGKGREDASNVFGYSITPETALTKPLNDDDELFASKADCFNYLKDNYLIIEDAKKTISGKGWAAVDEVHVVGLIKMFVNSKAKLEDPPPEIRQHFKNWIFREPLKNLIELAENFKKTVTA